MKIAWPGRIWKLDLIRGILIIGLVIYHLLWDLNEWTLFTLGNLTDYFGPIRIIGASLFLAIVGISLSLSYQNRKTGFVKRALFRGVSLIAIGAVITVITWFFDPKSAITFGILSVIGASILLSFVVVTRPIGALLTGILLLVEGALLSIAPRLPLSLGWIAPSPFLQTTYDYYPILPWVGLVFIGIYFGHRFFPQGKGKTVKEAPPWTKPILWCGRHTLAIYLLHQPIIIGFLLLRNLA